MMSSNIAFFSTTETHSFITFKKENKQKILLKPYCLLPTQFCQLFQQNCKFLIKNSPRHFRTVIVLRLFATGPDRHPIQMQFENKLKKFSLSAQINIEFN